MSVMEARLGGRRVAARNAAERRKKIILAGLVVLLVALLAFELPKLLKGSESSATAPVPVSAVPARPAPARSLRSPSARRSRLQSAQRPAPIRRMAAKDPFVPLIRENAATRVRVASTPASSQPAVRVHVRGHASRLAIARVAKPVPCAVKPTAAVISTNGHRQVIGVRAGVRVRRGHVPARRRHAQDDAAPGRRRCLRGPASRRSRCARATA